MVIVPLKKERSRRMAGMTKLHYSRCERLADGERPLDLGRVVHAIAHGNLQRVLSPSEGFPGLIKYLVLFAVDFGDDKISINVHFYFIRINTGEIIMVAERRVRFPARA